MNDDHAYGAMPKLYGAPAYARPPAAPVNPVERPVDPDDLPLEAERLAAQDGTADGDGLAAEAPSGIPGRAWESAVATGPDPSEAAAPGGGSPRLRGRPFRLRIPGRR